MKRIRLLACLAFCCQCVSTSDDRAAFDEEVGHAATEEAELIIDEGLAAIRALQPGDVTLWTSAPAWTGRFTTSEPTRWRFVVDNALPDAELGITSNDGDVPVSASTGERATQRAFEADLPAGTVSLRFGPPDRDDRAPFRIAVMSDIQDAVDDVQDMFDAIEREPGVRFLLGAGDLAQNGRRDQLLRVQRELRSFDLPYYTTLGNHDVNELRAWQELYGRGSFQFRYRGVVFTMIDSAAASVGPVVYEWLDDWLMRARNDVHVVAMHIPPLDPVGVRNGGFGSRHEAGKLLTRLGEGRVDLTVYGHIHSFYAFENAGIPAIISGGGGAIPERLDGLDRHFVVLELGADDGLLSQRVVEVETRP